MLEKVQKWLEFKAPLTTGFLSCAPKGAYLVALSVKSLLCNAGDLGWDPWVKLLWKGIAIQRQVSPKTVL